MNKKENINETINKSEKRLDSKEQADLFFLIGRTLRKKVKCYAVGGTAMMFLGLKETTKDIDLVFESEEDYNNFQGVLISLGAKEPVTRIVMREKVSSILSLKEARFDLFLKDLIHFKLSGGVISRIKEVHEFENLLVNIISPEDIILFKSMADREADRIDVANLIKSKNIEWEFMIKEAEAQTIGSDFFFIVFLYNFLLGVKEDLESDIPKEFLERLRVLSEKALLEAEKKMKNKS